MPFFQTEQQPDDPDSLPPARRRRAHRLLAPLDHDERAAFLDELARRASPSFDFFLFSLISAFIFSAALLLDSPAVLILGAVLAPLMAPVIGISLGTVIGSVKYFLRSLGGFLIGCLLVFFVGVLSGWAAQAWLPGLIQKLEQAHIHAQLSWPAFLVLAFGAIVTAARMTRSSQNPGVSSVALAYELYLPVVIAGFGLSSGVPHLWPDGLVVFSVHLAWGALLGALTLAVLGFRPLTLFGYTLGGAVMLLGVILVIGLSGAGAAFGAQIGLPTPVPTDTPTPTVTLTPTLTPVPPTETPTPTLTRTPTSTPTITPTPSPTPIIAIMQAGEGGGGFLRDEPGGAIIGLIANGTQLEISPETITENGTTWVQVRAPDGTEGWMVQSLLATATPSPE